VVVIGSGVGGGRHVYSAINVRPLVENYWGGHHEAISDRSMSRHYDEVLERMGSVTPLADHCIPNTSSERFRDSEFLEPAVPPPFRGSAICFRKTR